MRAELFIAGTLVNRLTRNIELTEGNGVKKNEFLLPTVPQRNYLQCLENLNGMTHLLKVEVPVRQDQIHHIYKHTYRHTYTHTNIHLYKDTYKHTFI